MFTWFCGKFVQETMWQLSSESSGFYRRYYKKNILVSFFPDTVYSVNVKGLSCTSYWCFVMSVTKMPLNSSFTCKMVVCIHVCLQAWARGALPPGNVVKCFVTVKCSTDQLFMHYWINQQNVCEKYATIMPIINTHLSLIHISEPTRPY